MLLLTRLPPRSDGRDYSSCLSDWICMRNHDPHHLSGSNSANKYCIGHSRKQHQVRMQRAFPITGHNTPYVALLHVGPCFSNISQTFRYIRLLTGGQTGLCIWTLMERRENWHVSQPGAWVCWQDRGSLCWAWPTSCWPETRHLTVHILPT